jgi:hypothetical protein
MGDRIDIDTGQLPGIVRGLGDRARDLDGVVDDVKDLTHRVQGLLESCGGVGGNLSLAWTYVQHARDGLYILQKEVGARAMQIARSECNSELADDITDAMKPPKKGGLINAVHIGLDVAGMFPVVGELADGTNALIYIGQGDWANAAISAGGMIPIGGQAATGARLGARAIKIGKGVRRAR